MKIKILSILLFGFGFYQIQAQTARVQVIHNAADAAASQVDVYLGSTLLIDDFEFRTASSFINAPAGTPIHIGIAPGNSTSAADTIVSFTYTLVDGETYVIVANGIVSASGYTPATAFNLDVYAMGQESAGNPNQTDVLVYHGVTDAPQVDVVVPGAGTVVNNIAYAEFQGYLNLPTADYTLNVTLPGGTPVIASYQAPLQTLGLEGEALVVLASGFLDPAVNNNGPAFGLWVALPSGGNLVELPASKARLQVIHNAADPAANQVDVYLNDGLLIDDFAFRTASAFIDAPAEVTFSVGVAPSNSTSSNDAIANFPFTLEANKSYIVVANGTIGTGFTPTQAFNLYAFEGARESANNATETDVLVFHGSTDAPVVDVVVPGAGTVVDDIAYGEFAGYLGLAPNDYTLNITDASGNTTVASYQAPLQTLGLEGEALVVLASGFLDPSVNNNGPAFGLWVALASGGQLVELPSNPLSVKENYLNASFLVYPNPTTAELNVSFDAELNQSTEINLLDMTGKVVYQEKRNATSGMNHLKLDVLHIQSGLYILQVNSGNSTYIQKVQISK
jgi:hypothetical protein